MNSLLFESHLNRNIHDSFLKIVQKNCRALNLFQFHLTFISCQTACKFLTKGTKISIRAFDLHCPFDVTEKHCTSSFNILYNFPTFSKNWNHSESIRFLSWFSKSSGWSTISTTQIGLNKCTLIWKI